MAKSGAKGAAARVNGNFAHLIHWFRSAVYSSANQDPAGRRHTRGTRSACVVRPRSNGRQHDTAMSDRDQLERPLADERTERTATACGEDTEGGKKKRTGEQKGGAPTLTGGVEDLQVAGLIVDDPLLAIAVLNRLKE